MADIEDEFKAESKSLRGLFEYANGSTGFKIPIYQRPYNWDKTHISRLIEDVVENIDHLIPEKEENKKEMHFYTFLGAMIITKDKNPESDFKGNSYLVIDGQQRLTTLSLLACVLIKWLCENEVKLFDKATNTFDSTQARSIKNLLEHFSDIQDDLFLFCLGKISRGGKDVYFPKIIRGDRADKADHRSNKINLNDYHSDLAKLLDNFKEYFLDKYENGFSEGFNFLLADTSGGKKIKKNLKELENIVKSLSINEYEGDKDSNFKILKNGDDFKKNSIKSIFHLEDGGSENSKFYEDFIKSRNKNDKDNFYDDYFFPFLRICLFAQYLINNVIITIVRCPDEDYALSIFEKINTAGEPLTALETFKPDVQALTHGDKRQDKDRINEINLEFLEVEQYVNNYSEESLAKRKNVSADVILAFHLYYFEKQGSKHLASQRRAMKRFSKIENIDDKLKFVKALNDICKYREKFWDNSKEISENDIKDPIARVCLLYLRAMNKTLTIPLLAKIFAHNNYNSTSPDFIKHVKSITAFTLLWRAYTGTTSGIDGRYRFFIKKYAETKDLSNILHEELLYKIGVEDKIKLEEKWLADVTENELYENGNRHTAKFFLLCAEDKKYHKENRQSPHRKNYLDDLFWSNKLYETIEHIAPEKPQENDEDGHEIRANYLTHTIGNLSLLPRAVNSSASNAPWSEKKELYKALSKSDKDEVINCCKNLNGKFSGSLKGIEETPVLSIVKDLSTKKYWNSDEVKKRSKEILKNVWDELYTWI